MLIGLKKMRNNLFILLYIMFLLIILMVEFLDFKAIEQVDINNNYSIDKNEKIDKLFTEYTNQLIENNRSNQLWGIVIKKSKDVKLTVENNKTKEIKLVDVIQKRDELCVEKNCFKLLGIFTENGHAVASFYNSESKDKLRVFSRIDIIDKSIYIESIVDNRILFKDENSTREWSMKLFDINSTKYKPKELE